MRTTKHFIAILLCALLSAPATLAQNPQRNGQTDNAVSQDVLIIIQQQQVRFTAQKAVEWMQLQVFDQSGEAVFDSSPVAAGEINWPLQNANGEAIKSGLYAYTLSIKEVGKESGAETARVRRGHFIVDRAKDRDGSTDKLWMTSQNDNGVGTELTVARDENTTVAGAIAPRREEGKERGEAKRDSEGERKKDEKAAQAELAVAGAGTSGQIAKFISEEEIGSSNITEVNGNVGIGTASPSHQLSLGLGPIWTSNGWGGALALENASAIGWKSNVAGNRFGIGQSSGGLYFFRTASDPGTAGAPANYDLVISDAGNVGIGTTSPRADFKLHVVGGNQYGIASYSTTGAGVYGESAQFNGVHGVAYNANHGATVGIHEGGGIGVYGESSGIGVFGRSTGISGVGVWGESLKYHGVHGVAHDPGHGAVVGDHRQGGIAVYGTSSGTGVWGDSTSASGFGGIFRNTAGGVALSVVGTAKVGILQITGGADFAENFDVSVAPESSEAMAKVEAGLVVSIDPDNPGRLALSTQAYDSQVAGIISGAGGVKPGMVMSQEGTLAEGKYPVALSGRVFCWADASNGPIKPGDLLTTSATPGHAMKVTDREKAQGAIIGKAMTGLKEGKGLVLVLVTLQ